MKNQSGRSMIEMLGVLAIIGVLSLGGVAVFNAAMNRQTANNLTYDVMLMAESTVSLGPQEQMSFDASTKYDQMSSVLVGGVANVIVNDVDKEICDILISKGGNGVFVLENQADGTPLADCDDEGTDIVFAFRDGYLPDAGVCNPTCDPGHICSNRQCCPTRIPEYACSIEPTEACASVTPPSKRDGAPCGESGDGFCQNGDCVEWDCSGNWTGRNCDICDVNNLNCGDAKYVDSEHCLCVCENEGYTGYYCSYSCPTATGSVFGLSKSACEACTANDGVQRFWKNGNCYGCGYPSGLSYTSEVEAAECENICAGSGYNRIAEGTYCHIPTNTTCPSVTSTTSKMSKSVCEKCDNTVWKNGTCFGCGYSSSIIYDTKADAIECMDMCAGSGYERYQSGIECRLATNTTCPSLTSTTSYLSKFDCETTCGIGHVWREGYCYSCGISGGIPFYTEEEAQACEEICKGSGYERYQDGTSCVRATSTTCPTATSRTLGISKSVCEACGNTFWSSGGYCYGCGYSSRISFTTEAEATECMNICADSGYKREADGTYCYLANNTTCPSVTSWTRNISKSACEACGNAFWNGGNCYGCGWSNGISFATEAEAVACANQCADSGYNRVAEGTSCHIPTNTTCPSVTSSISSMSKSVCEKCDNTVWENGTCYGCGASSSISFATEAEATECMNMCAGSGYERYQSGETCYLATNTTCPSPTSSTSNMSKSACEACGKTVWYRGTCYGCGYSSSIDFGTKERSTECMNRCAGSGYERYESGWLCKVATNTTCPSVTSSTSGMSKSVCDACGNTFWSNGNCYGCGISGGHGLSSETEAEACVTACAGSGYERYQNGKTCYKADTTCPTLTSKTFGLSKSACEACTAKDGIQRMWNEGYCYGCGYSSGSIYYETEAGAEACVAACTDSGYPREVDKFDDLYYCSRK